MSPVTKNLRFGLLPTIVFRTANGLLGSNCGWFRVAPAVLLHSTARADLSLPFSGPAVSGPSASSAFNRCWRRSNARTISWGSQGETTGRSDASRHRRGLRREAFAAAGLAPGALAKTADGVSAELKRQAPRRCLRQPAARRVRVRAGDGQRFRQAPRRAILCLAAADFFSYFTGREGRGNVNGPLPTGPRIHFIPQLTPAGWRGLLTRVEARRVTQAQAPSPAARTLDWLYGRVC